MREKFIKSSLILIIGGFLTKILGMIIKIVMSRLIGTDGLALYMLILPTFSLFIGLSQFGMPTALAKLIAEDKKNNKRLFSSVFFIVIFINLILIFLIIISAKVISYKLLHNPDTYYAILAIALVIPFTGISSICRSYFFGRENIVPHVISNVLEDIVRLVLMIIGIPFFINKDLKYAVCFIILSNIISEGLSILVLLFFIPKNTVIRKRDLLPSKIYIKELLEIGFFNTIGRLIGSVTYFLEPIILTHSLLSSGYSKLYITREYGIFTGYVMPLLLLPSFFTNSISLILLPIISKEYTRGNITLVHKRIKQTIIFSLMIGLPITILFFLIPDFFLKLIYNTSLGSNYIRVLSIFTLFHYIQSPLVSVLEAIGKNKDVMISTFLGMLVRTIILYLLSSLNIGIYGLIFTIGINILVVTFYDLYKVRKYLYN